MNAIKRLSSFLLAICLLCNLGMTAGCPVALAADAPSESKEETTATTEDAQDGNVPPSEEPEEPDPASPTQGSAAPAASEPTTSTDDSASTPEEPVFSAVRQAEGWQTAVTYGISIQLSDGSCPEIFVTDSEDSVIPLQQMEDGSYQVTICSNGTYTVSTTVQDIPYNWEILETQIDSKAPQILGLRRTEQGWATKGSYTFTVVDELSGVQEVYLTVAQQTPVLLTADENGLYSFTLQENAVFEITVCDAAGNEAELQAEETQVDTVAPDILDLTRTAEGWSQSVIYTFRAEDDLSGVADVTVSIEGLAPFAPESSEGVYQFALDQNVAFQIWVSDAAGNITMIASEETQVDTTAPSLGTLSRSTEGWAQSAVYSFTAEDAASGVANVQILTGDGQIVVPVILNGSYTYTAAKNETFQILLTDAVGNTAQYPVTEDQIDTFGPEFSQIQREQESWTQEAAYSFTVADNAAGIRSVRVLLENGTEASLTEENGRYRFTLTQNSEFTIVAEDMVGNTSEVTAQEGRVDTLAPQILELTRLESGWATTATYSFRAEDTQAGIASVAVVIGGEEPQLLDAVNGVYTVTVFENTVLTITVTDGAGNTSSVTQEETQIDTVAPVVSEISREKESWQQIVQYTFAAEDTQSGIESVVLEVNGNSAKLSAENGAYRFTAEANGTYTIRVTDKVGNTTVQTVSEELVDTQPPMIRDLQRATSNWATETSYSFQAEDVQSGIVAVTLLLPDGTGVELTEADGSFTFCAAQNGLYTITVTDGVGHTSQVEIEETQIDREGPVFGKVIRVTNSWNTSAQYEFAVQDANVQVSKVLLVVGQEQTELTALDGVYSFILPKNGEFTILAEDELGNRTEYRTEEAQVDTILPKVSVPARQMEGWQPSVTYVFHAEDNASGIRKISVTDLDGNTIPFAPHSEGYSFSVNYNTVVKIAVTDWAGNITEVTTEENFVDTTAPQILDVQRGTMGWSQNALFNFRVEDIQSGVAAVEVLLGDAPVPVVQTETGYAFLAEANGTYRIRVTDTAGNIAVVSASEKQIDQTPPKIWDISDGGQWDDNVILISFCVSDESQMGSVTLTDENGIQMEPFTRNGTLYYDFIYANGTYTITVTDAAGNETSAPLEIWRIDAEAPQAPVLTSSAQELWVNSDVILTAQSHDSQSGVINYWYTTDPDTKLPGIEGLAPPADPSGSTQYQIHPYDIPYDIHAFLFFNGEYVKTAVVADDGGNYLPKLEEDGIWEIRTHIQDALGNEFRHETQEVRIDTTVPEVLHIFMNGNDILQTVEKEELQYLTGNFNVLNNLAAKPSEYYLSEPVTISVEAWDATSGMARIYYNLGSSTVHPGMENGVPAYTWTQLPEDGLTISEEGEYVLTVMVVDNAGNRTICSAKTFTLDLSAPGSDSSNFDITLRQQNLSAENVYFGDVAVDITVMEAPWNGSDAENLKDAVFSGLSRITYRVLADGVQTQTGQIYPGSGETEEFTNMEIGAPSYGLEKVIRWTGSLEIDSALNDSNAVVLEVTATDAAGNSRTVRTDLFRIDRTKPVVEASFDTNDPVSNFDGEAAFTGSRTLTVNVLDKNFLPEKSIITVKDLDTGKTLDYTWEGGEDVFSAVIPVTQDGHYTVSISVTDAAGNHMEKVLFADGTAAEDAFIIDNTRPVITAAWDNNTVSQER